MDFSKLKGQIPDSVLSELPSLEKYQINTPYRVGHFLGQCAHESANFSVKVENLNYSSQGLLAVFPKYFDAITAVQYQRQSAKIANKVYANRMGNGDEASGEGFMFRGRGFIQLTGKVNYTLFDKEVTENILEVPDLVSQKYPLLSAGWFWNKNGINAIADKGMVIDTMRAVTMKINGGVNG